VTINPVGKPSRSELHSATIFRLRQGDPTNLATTKVHVELLPHKPGEYISVQEEAYKIIVSVEIIYLQGYSLRK